MTQKQGVARYIIQIDQKGQKLDMPLIQEVFAETGVELDLDYGPVLVNPALNRYVVRGTATPEARARAEKIPGVRFFTDSKVGPASK